MEFLLFRQLFAEFSVLRFARRLEEDFLRVCDDASFVGEHAFRRLFKRWANENFVGKFHRRRNQWQ